MARKDSAQAAPSDVVDCEVPDWMGCDLSVCRVLQDTSMQIAANIRALGKQLHGACGQATACLPAPEPGGEAPFGCADECFTFLRAFDALSGALLLLAGDLELGVAAPLQKTILTLQEESSGRTKHWQQVRRRFAELQERYRRSQRKSMEARRSLEGSAVGDAGGWFAGRSRASAPSTRAASEQHAALCELARCEEELLRSEASLRSFEDESRERLVQLNLEKWQRMGEALSQGASSLRRLLPAITGKDAPDQEAPAWKGVIPPSGAPLESKNWEREMECPLARWIDRLTAPWTAYLFAAGKIIAPSVGPSTAPARAPERATGAAVPGEMAAAATERLGDGAPDRHAARDAAPWAADRARQLRSPAARGAAPATASPVALADGRDEHGSDACASAANSPPGKGSKEKGQADGGARGRAREASRRPVAVVKGKKTRRHNCAASQQKKKQAAADDDDGEKAPITPPRADAAEPAADHASEAAKKPVHEDDFRTSEGEDKD
ncbi:unnamed protein product [Prorocentrum cordatum]|uniref:Uncharacterized protein n=1 Tax=Prorocentrum cordatum TaxID=2364126 RepID=A0ABN9Q0F5_9DINO|nr:unnamed protein product [Polarella glacialis]